MSLIPEDKIKPKLSLNLAPMIDFLFLMLAFFATLAVTRATLFDSNLDLVQLEKQKHNKTITPTTSQQQINISIAKDGSYKWMTDYFDYPMETQEKIQKELLHQHSIGALPVEKADTQVLLHIDQYAPWQAIASLVYAIKEIGFEARPVYQPLHGEIIAENTVLDDNSSLKSSPK